MLGIEVEQEVDGRWIAEVVAVPGALAYGHTREEAIQLAEDLSRRILADRFEHDESD